ncbi:MAG: type II toxin-antitoxin system VapB family antitoxin [Candidatus Sericytochromatia bacterium]|nr:type II toxin-antitoxin system VapB family antitoxin [Candidatus Tanganyikabacteria bacterium]
MIRRTTIEISDDLLAQAKEVLGTTGLKDTVCRALEEVVAASRRRRLARLIRDGTAFDFEGAPIDRAGQWQRRSS